MCHYISKRHLLDLSRHIWRLRPTNIFFWNKTFLFFKIESWNFQVQFEIEFRETSQNFNSIRQRIQNTEIKIFWMSWITWNFVRFHTADSNTTLKRIWVHYKGGLNWSELYSTWRNLDFRGFFLFPSSLSTPKVAFTVNISKIENTAFFAVSCFTIYFNCPLGILLLLFLLDCNRNT